MRALAALPEPDRLEVFAAVNEQVRGGGKLPVLTWHEWEAARGSVSLGGNALKDCDRLYEDA